MVWAASLRSELTCWNIMDKRHFIAQFSSSCYDMSAFHAYFKLYMVYARTLIFIGASCKWFNYIQNLLADNSLRISAHSELERCSMLMNSSGFSDRVRGHFYLWNKWGCRLFSSNILGWSTIFSQWRQSGFLFCRACLIFLILVHDALTGENIPIEK